MQAKERKREVGEREREGGGRETARERETERERERQTDRDKEQGTHSHAHSLTLIHSLTHTITNHQGINLGQRLETENRRGWCVLRFMLSKHTNKSTPMLTTGAFFFLLTLVGSAAWCVLARRRENRQGRTPDVSL